MKLFTKQLLARIPHVIAVTDDWHYSVRKLRQHVAEGIQFPITRPRRHRTARHMHTVYETLIFSAWLGTVNDNWPDKNLKIPQILSQIIVLLDLTSSEHKNQVG